MHSLGQTYEAIKELEVLIRENASEALLFNISGVLYKEIGNSDKAIKSFIARAAADLSESERTSIFKTARKEFGKFANLKPLDGNLANEEAPSRAVGGFFVGCGTASA